MGTVLHYSLRVSQAIPPSTALPTTPTPSSGGEGHAGPSASFAPSAAAAGVPVPATSGAANVGQVAQIVAAAQAALANTVNLSPQAQQAVKMEAFHQLVANLVSQLPPGNVTQPSNWPVGGVAPQLQTLLSHMLQQATAAQPLPQQLVHVQAWPAALTQAVLQQAAQTAASLAATAAAPAGAGTPAAHGSAPHTALPALQTWLVQQGVVQGQDGERAFTLTLRVPVAWAQAQAALGSALGNARGNERAGPQPTSPLAGAASALSGALGSASPTGFAATPSMLPLPFAGSVQQLASGAMGLVMQPQVLPGSSAAAAAQAMRTSAILQLEFQPLAQAMHSAQATAVYMPAHMLPQDVQAMLQAKPTDPWLLMAQAQADENGKKQAKNSNEHNQNFCNRAGCQYQGRAVCAQPFCAEMNYLWSIDRAQRSSRL